MGFFGGGGASSNMVGATSSVAGTAGLVPAPAANQEGMFLRGDASFGVPPGTRQLDFINATQKGYYLCPLFGDTNGSVAFTANYLYLALFYIPSYTYTSIAQRRSSGTTGTAQTIRMGVYNCNQKTLEPTTLLFNTAETNIFSLSSDLSISINQTIQAGLYYIAIISSNIGTGTYAGTCLSRVATSQSAFITASGSFEFRQIPGLVYSHTGTSAAMPSDLTGSTFLFNQALPYASLKV